MRDGIKIVMIIAFGVVMSVSIYSNGVTSRQDARFEKEAVQSRDREIKLKDCFSDVDSERWEDWKLNCSSDIEYFEDSDEIKSCKAARATVDRIEKIAREGRENCLERYNW